MKKLVTLLSPCLKSKDPIIRKKLKAAGWLLLIFLGIFLIGRFTLLQLASHYFAPLSTREIWLSFVFGIRFDLYIFALFICPGLFLLFLPFTDKRIIKTLGVILGVLVALLALFLMADAVFFSIFNNHIGVEFFTAFTHLTLFAQMAFQTYWFVTFPLLGLFGVMIFLICRYCNSFPTQRSPFFIIKSSVLCVLVLLLMVLGIRSRFTLHGKALGIMESQVLGSQQTADLISNGAFYFLHAVRTNQHRKLFFDENPSAITVATQSEQVPDPANPFERQRVAFNHENKNYNFVLILLESFDPILLDKHAQAAPNLNKIKEESLYFKNFYSSGSRSLIGVSCSLFSIPYVWGLPTFTQGLGEKNFSRIAQYFNHKGYTTINVITDRASSDKANEMARYVGFDQFYAKEDIPTHRQYPLFNKGFDYEGFEFLLDKINRVKGNFFGYMFTSSTHSPYDIILSKEHEIFPSDTEENRFLNRVAYADDALGNFFQQARRQPWFERTVFFILPDHRAAFLNRRQEQDKARQNYKSFLFIYAPAIFKPQIIAAPATQEDLLPTLLDLLNSQEPYAATGQSLFDKDRNPTKYIYAENKEIYILSEQEGNTSFRFLDDISALSAKERDAVHFNEEVYRMIRKNKFKHK